jgi:hypothetical protein
MQQKNEDNEEGGKNRSHEKMKSKENNNRKETSHEMGIDLGASLREETVKLMTLFDLPKGLKRMRHHAYTNIHPHQVF